MNLTCPTCKGKCFNPAAPESESDVCPECNGTGSIAQKVIADLQAKVAKQAQEIEDLQQELGFERQRRGTKR